MTSPVVKIKPGQRTDRKGRSRDRVKFVMLHHWMLDSRAYRGLSYGARALYIELAYRFNGSNNGYVYLSCREAAERLNCGKDTAARWYRELESAGLIKSREKGSFGWKSHTATQWILTEHEYAGQPATKDFMQSAGDSVLESTYK